jgi:small-conductance mechanosensitive channel
MAITDIFYSLFGMKKLNMSAAFLAMYPISYICRKTATLLVLLLLLSLPAAGWAQGMLPGSSSTSEASLGVPENLTPEIIDGLLSRLTDSEIRAAFLEELQRQAAEQAAVVEQEPAFFMAAQDRLTAMVGSISTRVARWADRLANLDQRMDTFHERLGTASAGANGMVLSVLVLVGVSFIMSWLVTLATRPASKRLTNVSDQEYLPRLLRTFALGFLEMLPIFAFLLSTQLLLPFLRPSLGPLKGMLWIYTNGVWWGWIAVVVSRRVFAPYAKEIRITALSDEAATSIHGIIKRCVLIGLAGWLVAGIFLNLGFGFPPAIVSVALSGTVVILFILYRIVRNYPNIQYTVQMALDGGQTDSGTSMSFFVKATPYLMTAYILGAGAYWLLNWLERGQHQLYGPLGTLIMFLLLPIFDRLGVELVYGIFHPSSPKGQRFFKVSLEIWRVTYGTIALVVVLGFWGVNLLDLTKGKNAHSWASAGFDIVVTILLGYLIWRLIKTGLHTEERQNVGSEDVDPDAPPISRLDTLVPLFRNVLLGMLVIIVLMIVLSTIGFDIGPIIASAGIIGIAIGFGAQTLVRDIFSGIFFLIDDAFRVGEYIELDKDTRGEVESISIRSLQLRHHRGAVITMPFGELQKITNYSREWVIYKMPFRMEPSTDPQKFKKVVKAVGVEFMAHPEHGPKFLDPLKSQGVFFVDDDSALVMRVKFKCLPRAQFVLRREIYHRLRTVFAENDLHIARRKVEVVGPDDNLAAAAAAIADEASKTA